MPVNSWKRAYLVKFWCLSGFVVAGAEGGTLDASIPVIWVPGIWISMSGRGQLAGKL